MGDSKLPHVDLKLVEVAGTSLRAKASVTGSTLTMHGWAVLDAGKGPFVKPPATKNGGGWSDLIEIHDRGVLDTITRAVLDTITRAVLDAYEKAVAERQATGNQAPQPVGNGLGF